eukprot:4007112-Prorocentrum_lima.AAC.1
MSLQRHDAACKANRSAGEAANEGRESDLQQQLGPGNTSLDPAQGANDDDENHSTRQHQASNAWDKWEPGKAVLEEQPQGRGGPRARNHNPDAQAF